MYSPHLSRHVYDTLNTEGSPTFFSRAPHVGRHQGHSAVVELLLDHGADVNSCDRDGKTALGRAVQFADVASTPDLLRRGAGVDRDPF